MADDHTTKDNGPTTVADLFAENRKPVSYRSFGKMMDQLNAHYVVVLKSHKERVEALEQRIATLEAGHADLAAKALKGGAVWQRGQTYSSRGCRRAS